MKKISPRVQLAFALCILGFAIVVGAATSYYNQISLLHKLEEKAFEQRSVLYAFSELTDANAVDETISPLIKDCIKRDEYDALIENLDSLYGKDLILLQNLSHTCGTYNSETKAMMVIRLKRELNAYKDIVELIQILDADNLDMYEIEKWSGILDLEQKRSDLLSEETDIQNEIISQLLKGNDYQSQIIVELVNDKERIDSLLREHDNQLDELRSSVTH